MHPFLVMQFVHSGTIPLTSMEQTLTLAIQGRPNSDTGGEVIFQRHAASWRTANHEQRVPACRVRQEGVIAEGVRNRTLTGSSTQKRTARGHFAGQRPN
jgi:hypothetical protein